MFYMLKILIKFRFVTQSFLANFRFQDQDQDLTIKFNTKKLCFIH